MRFRNRLLSDARDKQLDARPHDQGFLKFFLMRDLTYNPYLLSYEGHDSNPGEYMLSGQSLPGYAISKVLSIVRAWFT